MTRPIMALVLLALLVPFTSQAHAQQTNAPPGNSAIDEYLETVPGAGGSTRPRSPAQRPGVLTAAERTRLARLGPDGRTLADAVDATAPTKRAAGDLDAAGDGRSRARGVLDAVTGNDGGGMGLVLPAILIGALLAAITLYVLRRRAAAAS